jgi:hypothetical protein
MKVDLYKDAALTCDLPDCRLRRGDVVKPVEHHVAPGGAEGFSVEVLNAFGETVRVTTVPAWSLEPLRADEILCVREG